MPNGVRNRTGRSRDAQRIDVRIMLFDDEGLDTVASFLQNAIRWSDPATTDGLRDELCREMASSVPSLRALGIFEVFEAKDARLRDFLAKF